MNEQASRFIGDVPGNYDRELGPVIFDGFATDLANRVAALGPASILELAAGTGIVTRKIYDALGGGCDLLATDLNEPMLAVAGAKFAPGERVRFEQADATDLPFEDDSFDVIACQFGVMFFPDKKRAYGEAHRVLRAGGSYVFNLWDAWGANPFAALVHNVVAGFFPEDPPGFYRVPFHYHDADVVRAAVSKAGFERVTVEYLSQTAKIPSAEGFARGLVFGNPLYEEVVNRGGDPAEVCAAVAAAIASELGDEMPLRALVVHAQKA